MTNHPKPKATSRRMVGVGIAYCVGGSNEIHIEWIDIDLVGALSWTDTEVDKKAAHKHGSKAPPTTSPPTCDGVDVDDAPGDDLCWWTGSGWQCGEA